MKQIMRPASLCPLKLGGNLATWCCPVGTPALERSCDSAAEGSRLHRAMLTRFRSVPFCRSRGCNPWYLSARLLATNAPLRGAVTPALHIDSPFPSRLISGRTGVQRQSSVCGVFVRGNGNHCGKLYSTLSLLSNFSFTAPYPILNPCISFCALS